MEEEVTYPVYRYIDTDLNRDDLLATVRHNSRAYKEHMGWDRKQSDAFDKALDDYLSAIEEDRITSPSSGVIRDKYGILSDEEAGWTLRRGRGRHVDEPEYDTLGRRRQGRAVEDFYANREVATYLDNIADSLYKDKKKKDEEAKKKAEEEAKKADEKTLFDFGKHGLWSGFMRSLAPDGEVDLDAWLALDPWDEEGQIRGTTGRANALKKYLTKYIESLPDNYDYGDYYTDRDAYLDLLNQLSGGLDDGMTDEDFRLLNALGASSSEYRKFFTTGQYGDERDNPSDEDEDEEEEEGYTEEEKEALNNIANSFVSNYNDSAYEAYNVDPKGIKVDTSKSADPLQTYIDNVNASRQPGDVAFFSEADLRNTDGSDYIKYLPQYYKLNPDAFESVTSGSYAGWVYIKNSNNDNDASVLGYNPSLGIIMRLPYWALGVNEQNDFMQAIENAYFGGQQMVSDGVFFKQEGGTVDEIGDVSTGTSQADVMHLNFGSNQSVNDFNNKRVERSEETSSKHKNAQLGKNSNMYGDNGLSASDIMRLTGIAADISAMCVPDVAYTAGAGLVSTFANLAADVKDGYGFWNTAGNFAVNLGLTALSVVPIFGQAGASGGRVVKTIAKLAPKLNKAITAAVAVGAIANGDELLASLKKIGKSGVENKMDVNDWRNIGLIISLVVGGANAAKSRGAAKNIKNGAKKTGSGEFMDVVVTREGGKEDVLRFGNKEVRAQLKEAGNDVDKINDVIHRYNSLKDAKVMTAETKTANPEHKWWDVFGLKNPKKITGTKLAEGAIQETIDMDHLREALRKGEVEFTGIGRRRAERIVNGEGAFAERVRGLFGNKGTDVEKKYGKPKFSLEESRGAREAVLSSAAGAEGSAGSTGTRSERYVRTHSGLGMDRKTAIANARKKYNEVKKLEGFKDADLASEKGRRAFLGKGKEYVHSKEYTTLRSAGYDDQTLIRAGLWRSGGSLKKKILWAQPGTPGINPVRNYGEGYKGNDDDWYNYGEYGSEYKTDISGIYNANPDLRSSSLTTSHGAEDYDYSDAQANTDHARKKWQDTNMRGADFKAWALDWMGKNPGANQSQMIAAYNKLIDSMYTYKRNARENHSGDSSYWQGDDVREFNRTNRALYGSANSAGGVHGYDEGSEDWNGTTTAQRFIDITNDDIYDLGIDLSDLTDEQKKFFENIAKDKTGRMFIYGAENPVTNNSGGSDTHVVGDKRNDAGGNGNTSSGNVDQKNWNLDFLPQAIETARFINGLATNKKKKDIALQSPVLLYQPMEAWKGVYGNLAALQQGYNTAGSYAHMAATPTSSDAALNTAYKLEAQQKGQEAINNGQTQNDAMIMKTRADNFTQRGTNQNSRYTVANQNASNLFNKDVSDLTAKSNYLSSNYQSADNYLRYWENLVNTSQQENKALNEKYELINETNKIGSQLNKYFPETTAADQELYISILSGEKTADDLSEEELNRYYVLSNMVNEMATFNVLQRRGIQYYRLGQQNGATSSTSFTPTVVSASGTSESGTSESDTEGNVAVKARGGKITRSEKIEIQRIRAKIEKMKFFQNEIKDKMNRFDKQLDRMLRYASKYVESQRMK